MKMVRDLTKHHYRNITYYRDSKDHYRNINFLRAEKLR